MSRFVDFYFFAAPTSEVGIPVSQKYRNTIARLEYWDWYLDTVILKRYSKISYNLKILAKNDDFLKFSKKMIKINKISQILMIFWNLGKNWWFLEFWKKMMIFQKISKNDDILKIFTKIDDF